MEANTPALIGNESLAVLQTAAEVLKRNQASVNKASEVGETIVAIIKERGMSEELDEKANLYMVQVIKTIKAMNERRAPITQLFTQVAKQFTTLENELKEGQTVRTVQQARNEFAAKKAEEKRKAEEAAKRKILVENEKVEVRKKIELDLIAFYSSQTALTSELLQKMFNDSDLSSIDTNVEKIKRFPVEYEKTHKIDAFTCDIAAIYLTKEEVETISKEARAAKLEDAKKYYWEIIDDLKVNIEAKHPMRKKELERIAILEKEDKAAAEKAKALAAAKALSESEKQKQEAADKQKASEVAAQSKADEGKMNNLFDATQSAVLGESKAQVRSALKMKITHQSAWVQVFQYWFENEGMTLGIEEIGKKSMNQMKAFCEKQATKTGELIQSKYIQYEEDFTAVNKA